MADKIDRKQLKRPDEFQVLAGKAMEWAVAHRGAVLSAAGAVVVLGLLIWGLSSWRSSREEKAGGELAEALELQSRPIAGQGPAQPGEETFPGKDQRTKAVIAALEKVRADYGSTTSAKTALAEIGFARLHAGDAPGAQKDLQDFLASAGDHPLRPFAQESLGYALEAQGKLDDARAAFEKLRDLGMPARADFQAARLALLQNKPDAKQQLERIPKDYPKDVDVVRDANQRLELAALPPFQPGAAPAAAPEKPAEKPAAKKPQGASQKKK